MAYKDFKTVDQAVRTFGLHLELKSGLWQHIESVSPSTQFNEVFTESIALAANIGTTKAWSELVVTPVLMEVHRLAAEPISYFSGLPLIVAPDQGLVGECDFILTETANQLEVIAPVLTGVVVSHDTFQSGLGPCVAQMEGLRRLRLQQLCSASPVLGVVTTGLLWRFLQLEQRQLQVDLSVYFTHQLPQLLGILVAPWHRGSHSSVSL